MPSSYTLRELIFLCPLSQALGVMELISGVATHLKRLNPQLLSIHCINNRLTLGTSQAAASVPYLLQFEEIVTSIYKFHHHSANRQSELAEIQCILGDPQLKFKEPRAVRWLSHA